MADQQKVKLHFLPDGYKLSVAGTVGTDESEVVDYGDVVELVTKDKERWLAFADYEMDENGEDVVGEDGETPVVPVTEYWCYKAVPVEDGDVEIVVEGQEKNIDGRGHQT